MTTTPQHPEALIAFLRARLDEDEEWANASGDRGGARTPESQERVLGDVAAKRAIITGYETKGFGPWDGCGDWCEWDAVRWTLTQLAKAYAGHPDYQETWTS